MRRPGDHPSVTAAGGRPGRGGATGARLWPTHVRARAGPGAGAYPPPAPGYGLRPSRAASGLGPRLNRRVFGPASNTLNRLGSSSKLGFTRLNRRVLGSASNTLNRLGSSSKLGFTRLNRV